MLTIYFSLIRLQFKIDTLLHVSSAIFSEQVVKYFPIYLHQISLRYPLSSDTQRTPNEELFFIRSQHVPKTIFFRRLGCIFKSVLLFKSNYYKAHILLFYCFSSVFILKSVINIDLQLNHERKIVKLGKSIWRISLIGNSASYGCLSPTDSGHKWHLRKEKKIPKNVTIKFQT